MSVFAGASPVFVKAAPEKRRVANTFALVGSAGPDGYTPRAYETLIEMRLDGWDEEHPLFRAAQIVFASNEPPAIVPVALSEEADLYDAYVGARFGGIYVLPEDSEALGYAVAHWLFAHRDLRIVHFLHSPEAPHLLLRQTHALSCSDSSATLKMLAACGGKFPGTVLWEPVVSGEPVTSTEDERCEQLRQNFTVAVPSYCGREGVVALRGNRTLSGASLTFTLAENAWRDAFEQGLREATELAADNKWVLNHETAEYLAAYVRGTLLHFESQGITDPPLVRGRAHGGKYNITASACVRGGGLWVACHVLG